MNWLQQRLRSSPSSAHAEADAKLSAGLARLRALDQRQASPELEQKLLRQWREQRLAAAAPRSGWSFTSTRVRVSTGLALILLAAGIWRLEQQPSQAGAARTPAGPHPTENLPARGFPHTLQAQMKTARAGNPAPRATARHTAQPVSLALAQRGWLPLPDSNPQLPLGRAMVVTLRIPGRMLPELGLISMPARSLRGISFPAQVLIGEDNFARAIRFVQAREEK